MSTHKPMQHLFHPSARVSIEELREKYPKTLFIALGQTIWWDEPMKAILRQMLDQYHPEGKMFLGVHDTDYFAKVSLLKAGKSRYELMPHNDGSTKDLWSAAGEISRLFGSESFPTRHDLTAYGIPISRLARSMSRERIEFLDQFTEAWGWRGLVYTGSRDLIVHRVPLSEVGEAIESMLRWGFMGTLENISESCCHQKAQELADNLLKLVLEFRLANPEKMLSDLYRHILPNLYELLLGHPADNIEVGCTAHLLRFNTESASLPRFDFVDLFLNENTRRLAINAYNSAVTGSEMYTLDRFGLGALPFDLVLPEYGRGTLRLTLRAIHVETRDPVRIPLRNPVHSVKELAEILSFEFGEDITLVGKAVALVSMLAKEFIFVFNEEGSMYVNRTRHMNNLMRKQGVTLMAHPILRMRYNTWDALTDSTIGLKLPEYLKQTIGDEQILSGDFAVRWRVVIAEQESILAKLKLIRSPRELMSYLTVMQGNGWKQRVERFEEAQSVLRELRVQGEALQKAVAHHYIYLKEIKRELVSTEHEMCAHFHSVENWTENEEAHRASLIKLKEGLLTQRRLLLDEISDLKNRRLSIEKGQAALGHRAAAQEIEMEAQMERLSMVRNAILTIRGLEHTQHRPSAWWIPLVDPTRSWFQRIAQTTEVYLEPLLDD